MEDDGTNRQPESPELTEPPETPELPEAAAELPATPELPEPVADLPEPLEAAPEGGMSFMFEMTDAEQRRRKAELLDRALEQSEMGEWAEAAATNRAILEFDAEDVQAHNRLGRSLLKLGKLREALESFEGAVAVDPADAIALRNRARLQGVLGAGAEDEVEPARTGESRAENFVMETGRSTVVPLEDLSPSGQFATLLPGDSLQLRSDGPYLRVLTEAGERVGTVPASGAHRALELMAAGNEYSADVLSASAEGVRVLLRETHRTPETHGRLPFPAVPRTAAESRAAARAAAAITVPVEEEFVAEADVDDDARTDEADDNATESLPDTDDTEDDAEDE